MTHTHRVLIALAPIVLAACSAQSPVAPDLPAVGLANQALDAKRGTTPGVYDVSFLKVVRPGPDEPVVDYTLNVGEDLVLVATITDASGDLATKGLVTYEFCARGNNPVQRSECDSGRGKWARLLSSSVGDFNAAFWGTCSTPRTIGFRIRYTAQGGTIANGVSPARDVTWE